MKLNVTMKVRFAFRASRYIGASQGFTSHGGQAVNGYSEPPSPKEEKPDFYCRREFLTMAGYTEDTTNTVTQSGIMTAWATNALNEAGRNIYEETGVAYTDEYRKDDFVFRGQSKLSEGDDKILRFHIEESNPGGQYHASIRDLESKAQLRFNGHAYRGYTDAGETGAYSTTDAIKVAVQKFLDLDGPLRNYSSEARFTPTVVEVEISRTRSGKQQVRVENHQDGLRYSNTRAVGELFEWLKFKP